MAIIQEDVKRLDCLITDISDASRIDAELSRAKPTPVDLSAVLGALGNMRGLGAASPAAEDGHQSLRFDKAEGLKLSVNGVQGRLVQVFSNLMANAASFS